jgi:hypothetical protein
VSPWPMSMILISEPSSSIEVVLSRSGVSGFSGISPGKTPCQYPERPGFVASKTVRSNTLGLAHPGASLNRSRSRLRPIQWSEWPWVM